VTEKGQNRFGQTRGRVHCGGLDVNAEQVRRGMAYCEANTPCPLGVAKEIKLAIELEMALVLFRGLGDGFFSKYAL